MEEVGKIGIGLYLDNKQFNQEVKKLPAQMNNVGNKLASSFNSAGNKLTSTFGKIGKACAAAFSVAAITGFVKAVTTSAAAVQAAESQFSQTFGDLSDKATAAMKQVADESGIVETRLRGVGTSIYAFAKTTGMDSAAALSMMREALQVTADSAAYYDRSLEDTAESLKSFLKGNYANDAALGLSCTETTRNAAANKLYGKSFKDLSEAQKQLTLLQMVKDANAASGALGQAARESDGLENVLGNLKETWNQFLAVIGKPVLKVAVVVIQKITAALSKLIEVAKTAVGELGKLFGWDEEESQNSAQTSVQATADSIAESVNNQEALTEAVKKTNQEVQRGVASFDRLNIISKSSADEADDSSASAGTSDSGASQIASVTQKAESAVESINDKIKDTFSDLYNKSGFKSFVTEIQKGINKVDWSSIKNNCKSIFDKLKPIAQTALTKVQEVSAARMKAIGAAFGAVITIGGKSLQTLTGGISKWLQRDGEKIQGFINTIGDNLTAGFDNLSSFFNGIGEVVGDSIDRMRPFMEGAIADLLSGITDLAGGIGTVLSGAFSTGTKALSDWIKNDGAAIGRFFNNLQAIVAEVFGFIGKVFSDVGTALSDWWNGEGAEIFRNVCDAVLNFGTTLMNVWNDWIKPAWDFIAGMAKSAWENWLYPVFSRIIAVIGKIANCIAAVWNNFLSPIVNWIVSTLGPVFTAVFNEIGSVVGSVFKTIGGWVSGLFDALGGLIDFITGVFSGDWEKAWEGIKSIFEGVWNAIWSVLKFVLNLIIDALNGIWSAIYTVVTGIINLIIDCLNTLWSAVYSAVSGIVNTLGSIAGAVGDLFGQDWHFSIPDSPPLIPKITAQTPLIPKLASGGIVKAPTLALVGDNAGAGSGNPEVVAPLNKLQTMIDNSGGYDVMLLTSILEYLKKLYELFVLYRSEGGRLDRFTATLDGEVVFDNFVEKVRLYKMRHHGDLPF